jgi:hypothetical protein
MTEGGCGHAVEVGGNGNANIDFLLNEVQDAVNQYLIGYGSGWDCTHGNTYLYLNITLEIYLHIRSSSSLFNVHM